MSLVCLFPQDEGHNFSVGSKLLSVVYKGIAPGGERISLPSLDISSKRLADRLLQLAFAIDDQVGYGSPVLILNHHLILIINSLLPIFWVGEADVLFLILRRNCKDSLV